MLDPEWNGWKWFCTESSIPGNRMNIYVYPVRDKSIKERPYYDIYLYWDWDGNLKYQGIPLVD